LLEVDSRYRGTTAQAVARDLTRLIPSLASQGKLIGVRVGPY